MLRAVNGLPEDYVFAAGDQSTVLAFEQEELAGCAPFINILAFVELIEHNIFQKYRWKCWFFGKRKKYR